ncbi:MAG: hypothetical protein ACJ8F7_08245 [Gemmataceae bacterium]
MFSITRREFLDWHVGPTELGAISDLWLAWHDLAARQRLVSLQGYHATEIRLWGCPRRQRDALMQQLRQRLNANRELEATVEAPQPDCVTLTTPFRELTESSSLADWWPILSDPILHGLVVMVRFSVHDWRGPPVGPAAAGGTIVLVGHIEADGPRLTAIWPAGLERGPEGLYEKAAWPGERDFIRAALQRHTGHLPPDGAKHFAARPAQKRHNLLLNLFFRFPGQPRLRAFLARASFHLATLLAVVALAVVLPDTFPKFFICTALGIFFLTNFLYVVGRQARDVATYYRRMYTALKRVYSHGVRFYELDADEQQRLLDDANGRKYSRDLEDLGLIHLGDVHHEPSTSGTTRSRVFQVPGQPTYVFLNLMFATGKFVLSPAKAYYLINTYLDEGHRVFSANDGGGFRRRLDQRVTIRFMPDVDHPGDLLERHRHVVDRELANGRRLAPPMNLEGLLRRQEADHEEQRQRMERYGYYSWPAAFRQCFRLVRREYLDPPSPNPHT